MTTHIYTREMTASDPCGFSCVAYQMFMQYPSAVCVAVTDCGFDRERGFQAAADKPHGGYAIGVDWDGHQPYLLASVKRSRGQKLSVTSVYSVRPHDPDHPMWRNIVPEVRRVEVLEAMRRA